VEPDLMLELDAGEDGVEVAADRLWQAGAEAVELRAGSAVASFPTKEATRSVAHELTVAGAPVRLLEADPSWRDAWRAFATPIEVGAGLVVAPAWRDVTVGGGRIVLRIDPGECFGSGSHPSTRMILAALDRRPPEPDAAVLDAGCGSGVLSVAAALLGARRVVAVDIDPAAVEATSANARTNGVAGRVDARLGSVGSVAGPFDLALVNVTAGVHAAIGPDVVVRLAAGGRIVLAGLLPGQWRHIEGSYPGAVVVEQLELDGWEGLELSVASTDRAQ
jgi:ribosomal protein L11 methyltransferase